MESVLDFLTLITKLLCTVGVIVLFFAYLVRPLLRYLFVNHEIETRKRQHDEALLADAAADLLADHPGEADMTTGDAPQGARPSSKQEMLDRLATSDPGKAGDLVKKWIHSG